MGSHTVSPHAHGITAWDRTRYHRMGSHTVSPHGIAHGITAWDRTRYHRMGSHTVSPHGIAHGITAWDRTRYHRMGSHTVSPHGIAHGITPCPAGHEACMHWTWFRNAGRRHASDGKLVSGGPGSGNVLPPAGAEG
eukprot:Polyplicarium_translucidae@DN2016_c0_g1_i4.p5